MPSHSSHLQCSPALQSFLLLLAAANNSAGHGTELPSRRSQNINVSLILLLKTVIKSFILCLFARCPVWWICTVLAHRQDPGSSKIPEGQTCPTHTYTQDGRGAEPCSPGLAPPMHRGTVLNARRVAVCFSSEQEQGARGLLALNAPGATQSSSEAPLNTASLHNLQQP